MNTYEEYDEEELIDYSIQLSIQNSCQDAFLKSAARYESHIQTISSIRCIYYKSVDCTAPLLPLTISLAAATDENLRVLAAIEQGELDIMLEIPLLLLRRVFFMFSGQTFIQGQKTKSYDPQLQTRIAKHHEVGSQTEREG